jgi:glutathione S-transferase
MIKVFHAPRTRSLRVLWMAEEMGLPIGIEGVDLRAKPAALLAVNPAGTLPAMVDGPVTITESVAILQYLADRYGPTDLSLKADEPDYPAYLQFLLLGEAGLAAPLNAVIGTRLFGPEDQKQNWTVGMVVEGFVRRAKLVEQRLEGRRYLAGDRFTAADISVAYAVGLAQLLGIANRLAPHVLDYHARMAERPAYQRAAAQ